MKNKIMLRREEVMDFVNLCSSCDFDVDLGYDRVLIDAKSILGVLSLDLGRELTVSYPENCEWFAEALKAYDKKRIA